LIAVEEQALAVDTRLDRLGRPASRYHLLAIPLAAGQQQAAELGGVARPQAQAAESAELATDAGIQPFEIGSVDGLEEFFARVVAQRTTGGPDERLTEQ